MDKKQAEKIASFIEEMTCDKNKDNYWLTIDAGETTGHCAIEMRPKYNKYFDHTELKLFESIRYLFDLSMYITIESDGKGLYARFIS